MKIAKKNFSLIIGSIVLIAATFAVFNLAENKPKSTSAFSAPEITMIVANNTTAIIYAKSTEPNATEQFVYCVSDTEDSSACSWENYDEFGDLEEGTYYAFVKSLASNKVSPAKKFVMQKIDYKNIKI